MTHERSANPLAGAAITYLSPGYAAVYDLAVFAVLPARASIAGAALVIAGGSQLGWRERVQSRRGAESSSRSG